MRLFTTAELIAASGVPETRIRSLARDGVIVPYSKDAVAGRGGTEQALWSEGTLAVLRALRVLGDALGDRSPAPRQVLRAWIAPDDAAKADAATVRRAMRPVEIDGVRIEVVPDRLVPAAGA